MADPYVLSDTANGHHPDAIYHEHQALELCLLHALNNLFQGQAFAKESLEIICKEFVAIFSDLSLNISFLNF